MRDLAGEPTPVDADERSDLVTRGWVPESLERLEPRIDARPDGVDEGPIEVEDNGRRTRNPGAPSRGLFDAGHEPRAGDSLASTASRVRFVRASASSTAAPTDDHASARVDVSSRAPSVSTACSASAAVRSAAIDVVVALRIAQITSRLSCSMSRKAA